MNRWNIPDEMEKEIIIRDNIARCCSSCNSSKGTKKLSDWINSE